MGKYTKDHVRDYATAAFRFYAKEGSVKKYIEKMAEQMKQADEQMGVQQGVCKPTEAALMRKERVMRERVSEVADLEAVERTLHILGSLASGREIRKAVEYVYFEEPWKDLEKGDIQARVHRAELYIPASERQIYYWLKKARTTLAEERGLRV